MSDIRILIVTDGWNPFLAGSYDDTRAFSLSHLVRVLRQLSPTGVACAHRGPESIFQIRGFEVPQPADVIFDFNFVTSNGVLEAPSVAAARLRATYDEIWLFGVEPLYPAFGNTRAGLQPGDPNYVPYHIADPMQTYPERHLTPEETQALFLFNDAGGGLFATGDHEDLGWAMCGNIPRIRHMRDWWYPGNVEFAHDPDDVQNATRPPDTRFTAPSGSSSHRHDTLVLPYGTPDPSPAAWDFYWQNDRYPQRIHPAYGDYRPPRSPFGPPIPQSHIRYPHPLLCGPLGPVDYLPDHPHEGNCRVPDPDDAGTTVDVDGEGTPRAEWPLGSGGRPFPTVVATAHVSQHVTASPLADLPYLPPVKPQTEATDYPVICAYDGHQARVGRVAVDATWHHFFNVNVNQMAGARVGEAGYAEWLDITQYYWNLARWLAPVELHEELIIENLLQAIEAAQILEDPRFNQPGNEIGQRVREALQHAIRDAGPCLIIDTVIGVLRHHIDIHLPDPWWSLTLPPKLLPDPDPRPRNTPGRLTPDIRVWDPIVLVESALTEATAAAVFEVTKLDSDPKVHDPDALRSAIISGLIDGVIAYSRAIRIAYESAAASAVHLDQDLAARGRRPDDD